MKYLHTVGDLSAVINVVEDEITPQLVPLNKKFIQAPQAEYFEVRKSIAEKLELASYFLPKEYQFKIFETYRSREKQIHFWNLEIEKIKKENPTLTDKQVEEIANNGIANPYKIGSGHQTGGAIDITVCYNGIELDMGTTYLETENPKTKTDANGLSPKQFKNRHMLKSLMEGVGLVNYPLEWWHYSYGEHEWAVLTKRKNTLYKAINNHPHIRE